MDNFKGNITTLIKIVSMTLSGYLVAYLSTKGLNMDEQVAAQLISTLSFFALSIIDSKYPNTFSFFENAPEPLETEETVLNDDYES